MAQCPTAERTACAKARGQETDLDLLKEAEEAVAARGRGQERCLTQTQETLVSGLVEEEAGDLPRPLWALPGL